MIIGFIPLFLVAVVDWVAVAKGWKKLEYVAKPATLILLLGWLAYAGGFRSVLLVCFGLGVFFSLAGDIFLMIPSDQWFIPGLAAFLLAHVAYIIGLNTPLPDVSPILSTGVAIVLALAAGRILGRIITGLRVKKLRKLEAPVAVYAMVITLMLLSAILTLFSPNWKLPASGLVALGAILFYLSDLLLAWDKFVNPVKNGRLANMILYHLGQFALVAGVLIGASLK